MFPKDSLKRTPRLCLGVTSSAARVNDGVNMASRPASRRERSVNQSPCPVHALRRDSDASAYGHAAIQSSP